MDLPFRTFPQVVTDYKKLGSAALRREALRLIAQLKKSPFLGQPLEYRGSTGNLGDCRKLYFDVSKDDPPEYRIVYRLLPDEDSPGLIEIICLGERAGSKVYEEAAKRLQR